MPETILYWLFLLACIFAFWFGYGIVEDLIRTWYGNRKTRKQKPTPKMIDKSPDPSGNGHSDLMIH